MMLHGIERVDPPSIEIRGNVKLCAGIFGIFVAEDKDGVGLLDQAVQLIYWRVWDMDAIGDRASPFAGEAICEFLLCLFVSLLIK